MSRSPHLLLFCLFSSACGGEEPYLHPDPPPLAPSPVELEVEWPERLPEHVNPVGAVGLADHTNGLSRSNRPIITEIEPSIVPASSCAPLPVSGYGFVPSSELLIDGLSIGTPFKSENLLSTRFDASAIAPGEHWVQVQNPLSRGGLSTPFRLAVE